MAEIIRIDAKRKGIPCRKKVAAYARVSSASERQEHSLTAQISHYSRLIQSNPEWEYAGLYSDDGISGTSIVKRRGFQDMIVDADAGKIDIILTKSISRFARNTVDLLQSVRHLKDIGVEVRFEKENIRSLSADGELMLTILASYAQEESESISNNVKWGIRKKFERGEWWGTPPFGYDCNYRIVESEAAKVRNIYQEFLDDVPLKVISDEMKNEYDGFGSIIFVKSVLTNEAYIGNLLLQKSYSPKVGHEKKNDGDLPKYMVKNHHKAIVKSDTFEAVQKKISDSYEFNKEAHRMRNARWYSRKFFCELCGSNYVKNGRECLVCGGKHRHGADYCSNGTMMLERLEELICSVFDSDSFDEFWFTSTIEKVNVGKNGKLTFFLYDGTKKSGTYHFWTKEDYSLFDKHPKVFGYEWKDGRYTVLEKEAAAVKMLYHDYMAGASLGDLSDKMNSLGFRTVRGGFSEWVVKKILTNIFYTGRRKLRAEISPSGVADIREHDHEAIVSDADQDRVKARLMKYGRSNKDSGTIQ